MNIGVGQVPSSPGESSQAWDSYFRATFVEDMDDDSNSEHEDSNDISLKVFIVSCYMYD